MNKLASIEKILNLAPIDGADKIEVATILGWKVVVKKGEFKEGDLVVFHYPDTVLPERPEYEFMRKDNFRLKVKKFKKQISQGFVLSIDEMLTGISGGDKSRVVSSPNFFTEGLDISEMVGIKKYEKPVPAQLAGKIIGHFPSFLKKTDELNARSYPDVINEMQDKEACITLKMDGSSFTAYLKDEKFGVCSRNLELKEEADNAFWKAAREYKIEEALRAFRFKYPGDYCVQGEYYGPGVQGNNMKSDKNKLSLFNLFSIKHNKYANFDVFMEFCSEQNLPFCPVIWAGKFNFTLDDLIEMANKAEYAPGIPAEGIVCRPCYEQESKALDGRMSFKIISERYALHNNE